MLERVKGGVKYGVYRSVLRFGNLYESLMNEYDSLDAAQWHLDKLLEKETKGNGKKIYKVKDWYLIMPKSIDIKGINQCLKFGVDVAEWYEIKWSGLTSDTLFNKVVDELESIQRNSSITVSGLQRYLGESYPVCNTIMERLESEGYISKRDPNNPRKILKTK